MSQAAELLDVVDHLDRVIGAATRGEIHRRNLLHRSAHLLVFNAAGQVFLQKRSLAKDNNPGLWDSSVSGHVDSGESYDDCIVREAFEEIGLVLERTPTRLFRIDACPQSGFEFSWIYACRSEGPFALDPAEIDEGDWFSPRQVDAWLAARPGELAETVHLLWPRLRALPATFIDPL
jgi:isopentenyl-diphosphate Delta-isomerase